MIEYALLVSLISAVAFAGVSMVGHQTEDKFDVVAQGLDGQVVTATDDIEDLTEDDAGTPPEEEASDSDPEPDPGDSGGSGGSIDDSGGSDDSGGPGGSVGDEDSEPTVEVELDGSETKITSAVSAITDWKEDKKGGKGHWAATFDFSNDWKSDQVLFVEVTTTDEKGKTKTDYVKVSVPAGGSASLEIGGNSLTSRDGEPSGVMTVGVRVVSIATTDQNGNPVSYNILNGQAATVGAPAAP